MYRLVLLEIIILVYFG
ncbi:hypothetical protein F383_16672 [Gossypium arboreum]|uniref:Uncharacterized protein n=1 Tax=Gossypium arboreum TaxID=29729 RepID=A0A0B0MIA6_GOSAR|nr:hypothetical protein F383_16672 [Gossypium arboreum]